MPGNNQKHNNGWVLAAACFLALLLFFACANNAALPSQAPPSAIQPVPPPASSASIVASTPSLTPSATHSETSYTSPVAAQPTVQFLRQAVCIRQTSVYKQPQSGSAKSGQMQPGDIADIIGYQDKWVHISQAGSLGYVQQENLITKSSPSVTVPMGDWAKILVNPSHPLPQGFTVQLADFAGGQVDTRILAVCQNMFADAKKDGVDLKLVDAYRSRERQSTLYEQKVQSYIVQGYSRSDAEREAATITARPDTSEHQTGLAMDIVSSAYSSRDSGFANTRAFAWLNENAQNYGFTLRYGQGKESFTKVIYEPWHWRFVGMAAATDMKASGQCLEEYLGQVN